MSEATGVPLMRVKKLSAKLRKAEEAVADTSGSAPAGPPRAEWVGRVVRVAGLDADADGPPAGAGLNGRRGIVNAYDADADRFDLSFGKRGR